MKRIGIILSLWLIGLSETGMSQETTPDRGVLAHKAAEILRKHCQFCHEGTSARAELRIFDRQMLVETRKLIQPGQPEVSELFTMVDTGMMPPGNHPKVSLEERQVLRDWIIAGAVEPPTDQDFVLQRIAADWANLQKLPAEKRKKVRYLSLVHLVGNARARSQFEAARKELEVLLGALVAKGKDAPAWVYLPGTQESIVRIDLGELGWDAQLFFERDNEGRVTTTRSPVNLYDLLLLEYPYGHFNLASPPFKSLLGLLKETQPVRVVPYLRGDWLLGVMSNGPLREEFSALLQLAKLHEPGTTARAFYSPTSNLNREAVALELGWTRDRMSLDRALKIAGLTELSQGKAVSREKWERAYPQVIRELKLGTPILPFDALNVPDLGANTIGLTAEIVNPRTNQRKGSFLPGELMNLRFKAEKPFAYELIYSHSEGYAERFNSDKLPANRVEDQLLDSGKGNPVGNNPGKEGWILFALPGKLVDVPKSVAIQAVGIKGVRDRYVHPIYQLNTDGTEVTGAEVQDMVKKTILFEIRMPGKKK